MELCYIKNVKKRRKKNLTLGEKLNRVQSL